ncbi:hypothetical protein [Streptomyces sp. NPDC059176]|uniref:hypothetical protein n=1 Tax=Streptomyces sp. NPDC059176 TaxID=3346758 RepID=UPI0036BCF3C5
MTTIISAAADRMIGQFNAYHAANIAAGLRGPALGDFHNLVVEMVAEALDLRARMREITDLLASPCPFRPPRRGCPVTNQTETARPTRAVPGRRLVAAGFIRRTPGRTLTLDATGPRVICSFTRRTEAGQ